MLNFDMKRKINTLRDILVGKIPDPKSQVEQITIAMIYKFMDDMDTEFIGEWGGERKFFVKTDKVNYEKYAWSNIMQPQVSGEERSLLYREGIEAMPSNPNLPPLFRDVFRNAYIPFRDSETINMFLKEVNDFKYDNSEDLGNAFEMLLSIMGSQGDAGQFRTPRHVIDMIVDIIEPHKNDAILDPSCGTAGFLISAYKRIIDENRDTDGKVILTPDEKSKLTNNLVGYDISQDMVRLSRVNMYLHNFPDPKIYEYDTLTSQDRWDDQFDVILANPPFMTPKGGINPHNRFSVQAKRSEVLFVDYIAEHLNPNGRAGIIVPEGIVFQTANAYKDLRKMLVDNDYLYAVISLPAGVFNPYSGVKTSVLLFDKALAKKTDKVLFVKIENDGYDLGAQRRELSGSDIPKTVDLIKNFKIALVEGKDFELSENDDEFAVLGEKEDIKNKNYILVGERYRTKELHHNRKWPMVELGAVCDVRDGTHDSPKYVENGYPLITSKNIKNRTIDFTNTSYITKEDYDFINNRSKVDNGDIIMPMIGTIGNPIIVSLNIEFAIKNVALIKFYKDSKVSNKYICSVLESEYFENYIKNTKRGGTQNFISLKDIRSLKIPLPPISVQEQIVAEIESYQKIIDGAKQVIENYKPIVKVNPEWGFVELGEAIEFNPKKSEINDIERNIEVSFVPMADMNEHQMNFVPSQVKQLSEVYSSYTYFRDNDVILARVTPCFENGKSGIAKNLKNGIGFGSSEYFVLRPIYEKIISEWIYYAVSNYSFINAGKNHMTGTGGLQRLSKDYVLGYVIPLPSVEEQLTIIQQINEEMVIVDQNKRLIEIFEQKIKDKIAEVWGE